MIEPGTTKVYVTKYWSTKGIIKLEAEVYVNDDGKRYATNDRGLFVRIGTDAFESLTDALVKVKKAAEKKAASARMTYNRLADVASGVTPIKIVDYETGEKVREAQANCADCGGTGHRDRNKFRADFDSDGPWTEPCPCRAQG